MTNIRQQLIPLVRRLRGEIPGTLAGLRQHRVYRVETSSDGTYVGDGTITATETEILEGDNQPPNVEQPTDEQRALGGLAAGTLIVGPITPFQDGAGVQLSELGGSEISPQTDTLRIRVTGPIGDNYYRIASREIKDFRWMLTLEPVSEVPA